MLLLQCFLLFHFVDRFSFPFKRKRYVLAFKTPVYLFGLPLIRRMHGINVSRRQVFLLTGGGVDRPHEILFLSLL